MINGRTLVAFLTLSGLVAPLEAQSLTSGDVKGVVRKADGTGITGAFVTLQDGASGRNSIVDADDDGRYRFPLLAPGTYEILAEQVGFRPVRVVGIDVRPGDAVTIEVQLDTVTPPVTRVDTLRWGRAGSAGRPGADESYGAFYLDRLPYAELSALEAIALSSTHGEGVGVHGLPGGRSAISIGGVAHRVGDRSPALSREAFGRADLLLAPVDIEWSAAAGGITALTPRRGGNAFDVRAFGDWNGDAMASSNHFDPESVSFSSLRGGLVLSGPVIGDTAQFVIGGTYERLQLPRPSAWVAAAGDSLVVAAADSFGVDLAPLTLPASTEDDRGSVFGAFAWHLGDSHRLDVFAGYGRSRAVGRSLDQGVWAGSGVTAEQADALGSATITSRFGSMVAQELRLGFGRGTTDRAGGSVPATHVGLHRYFGRDPASPQRVEQTTLEIRDALHIGAGTHRLKLGVAAQLRAHVRRESVGGGERFYFGGPSDFVAQEGLFVGGEGTAPSAQFSSPQLGFFLQDRWNAAPGLELITALRYDYERYPRDEIARDGTWLQRTGIANDSLRGGDGKWSSRLGFLWEVGDGGWVVRGGAGTYYDVMQSEVLGEIIAYAGGQSVRRGAGSLTGWPSVDPAFVQDVGARLSLLGPDFEPVRSSKWSFGVARRLGQTGALSVAVNYRHTDFLPRRHDLNRPLGPTWRDQYGRAFYGTPIKVGALMGSAPGSNRRFADYELVSALDPDGYSDFLGVTFRLEQPIGRFLRLLAAYTYSETTDNWLGASPDPYGQLSPFPDSLGGADWADGRSDFDVPHRFTTAGELRLFSRVGLTVAAVYRRESGRAFTPGLAAGIDANGDGSLTNDPAYIDPNVTGMDLLLAAWPCLDNQRGAFAARNSCREPSSDRLDLRLAVGPARAAGVPIELWAEALNVTDAPMGWREHAVYVLDPATALVMDAGAGVITVPLVANPGFGSVTSFRTSGRLFRLGLRVGF